MPAYRQAAETDALRSCKLLITANPLTGKGLKEFCSCSFRGSTWFAYTCASPIACMKSPGRSPQTYRNNTSMFIYVELVCAIEAGDKQNILHSVFTLRPQLLIKCEHVHNQMRVALLTLSFCARVGLCPLEVQSAALI